jgi:hypothetical protein
MNNFLFRLTLFWCLLAATLAGAQTPVKYNLSELVKGSQLVVPQNQHVAILTDDSRGAVSVTGIVWLKGVNFSTGSIDVDIRGKDIFQQSFVGVAFHGVDTITHDVVYFRPFNFQSPDTLRRSHMVQYHSEPQYPWDRLRKEHPLMYESGIASAPLAANWFHAHIVVSKEVITVYVNHSETPCLKVKKLNDRNDGLIGLWSSALSGDFANLVIVTAE